MDANKCQNIEGVSQLTKKILTKYIPLSTAVQKQFLKSYNIFKVCTIKCLYTKLLKNYVFSVKN